MNNKLNQERNRLGNIIADILDYQVPKFLSPGLSLSSLAEKIEKEILKNNVSSIRNFFIDENYINCPVHISTGNVLCHGFPAADTFLQEGELVRVDLVVFDHGIYADAARTYIIGTPTEMQKRLLDAAREAVFTVAENVRVGDYISKIAKIIEETAKKYQVQIAPFSLSGHSIGEKLHQYPHILNVYLREYFNRNDYLIKNNDCFCVEPIFTSEKVKKTKTNEKDEILADIDSVDIVHYEQMMYFTETSANICTYIKNESK